MIAFGGVIFLLHRPGSGVSADAGYALASSIRLDPLAQAVSGLQLTGN